MILNEKIFREYDIRGIADTDLSNDFALQLGRSIGSESVSRGGKIFTLGRDCRISSPRLHENLLNGLMSTGLHVLDIGLVPTPLLYFSIFHLKADGGVMITGSHNPGDQNGFKICLGSSSIHGHEIQLLKKRMLSQDFCEGEGTVKTFSIVEDYISYVCKNITGNLGVKVVIDSGNGMGGMVAPALYRKLGCEVQEIYSELDGSFPNHHPDPTVLENTVDCFNKVKSSSSVVGIAFDGDADRIGVVDPSNKPIFGDELLVVYARDILKTNPKAKIISEVKASYRLYNDIANHGGIPIMWKTGHSLIKTKMKEEGALLAGEMSGHVFFNDRYFGYDDAIYAGARLLEILSKEKKTVSELIADLPSSFATPEIRMDCPDEVKFKAVTLATKRFIEMGLRVNAIDGARIDFDRGWGLVRASNTQPVLVFRFEASDEPSLDEYRKLIQAIVKDCIATIV